MNHPGSTFLLIGRLSLPLVVLLAVALTAVVVACRSPAPDLPETRPSVRRSPLPGAPPDKLTPALASALDSLPPDGRSTVVLELSEQVDLVRLTAAPGFDRLPRLERRRRVVAALARVAAAQQGRLRPLLDGMAARGDVASWRGYSVVNRIVVEATAEAIRELALRPEVTRIAPPLRGSAPALLSQPGGAPAPGTERRRSWGLSAVGVEAAWAQGLRGRGVLVGIVDSGASDAHRQLRPNHAGSWHDAAGLSQHPRDRALGHGSGVLSIAVGANLDGVVLGVAPEASWTACGAFPRGSFDEALLLDCADWMLNVAQPDVLINAWLLPAGAEPCDPSLRPVVEAWRAAQILPLFAAGNLGGDAGVNRPPANYGDLAPDGGAALSVGALARSGEPLADSAAGPNRCADATFPSLLAPGEELISALPVTPSAYRNATGTSYATGLAAGAAALLYQRFPQATVVQVEAALRRGAVDLGVPGPDSRSGYGRLDLPRSLEVLSRLRGGPAASAAATRAMQPARQR